MIFLKHERVSDIHQLLKVNKENNVHSTRCSQMCLYSIHTTNKGIHFKTHKVEKEEKQQYFKHIFSKIIL